MLEIRRQGSVADAIANIRSVPTRVIPYAASVGLTASAKEAQRRIVEQMPRSFDRPTPFTLNALRVVPSTAQTLLARVAVKDQAAGGIAPELFLEPEVEGGPRREKRYEKALRFAGILRPGERTIIGNGAPVDAFGNLSAGTIRAILAQVGGAQSARSAKRRKGTAASGYFVAALGKKHQRGIWLRQGGETKSILIFTTKQPKYRQRLDFTGIAEAAARDTFPREFEKAAADLTARFSS